MKCKRHIIFLLLIIYFPAQFSFAQTIEKELAKSQPDCQTLYINAMDLIPKLYRENSIDSLEKALSIWERSCGDMPEVMITRILLDFEKDRFVFSRDVDIGTLELLSDYARSFPSMSSLQSNVSSKGPKNSFYRLSSTWSKLLLKSKKFGINETFICKVLSGEIKDPKKEIEHNTFTYPEFAALLEKDFENKRKEPRVDIALSTGVWLPTQNLSTLGVHPSFGLHFGVRNMRHQLDLTLQIRYMYSANPYAVKIDGRLDSTDYYFGGYIGLDYNYYLISKKKFDFGILAGMGWDGFDFAPQPYDYYYYDPYYTSHLTIGSFNGNAGLRFNYYFTHSFYVGLQGRYNFIYYSTHGGTDLNGDAFSIDLIFGINGSMPRK